MAIKNIFKNKIVLYSIIIVSVLIVGILVWGVLTKWQFWNAQKSSPKPKPFGPDHKNYNCGPYCEKCDDTGNCEECIKSEHIHRIGKYCIKDNSHPCDNGETCALCNDDGKTCKNCKDGTQPDSKGRCCPDSEKVSGECCKKCGDICCDLNKECTTNGYITKCCDPDSTLDFNGECCPKDKLTKDGICCTNDKGQKCGSGDKTFCCVNQGGNNQCQNDQCELNCGGNTCTDSQNCDPTTQTCVNKTCEWDNDTPAYYPSINDIGLSEMVGETPVDQKATCTSIENGQIEGKFCQLRPYGIVEKDLSAKGAMKNRNTVMEKDINNNYITFLFPSSNISNSNHRFSKMTYETSKNSKKNLKCNKKECEDALGDIPESSTIWFDNRNNTCVSEEATTGFKSPSATNKCPFKDKTRCCINNKDGNWTGQVCLANLNNNHCIYDDEKKIGTCGSKKLHNYYCPNWELGYKYYETDCSSDPQCKSGYAAGNSIPCTQFIWTFTSKLPCSSDPNITKIDGDEAACAKYAHDNKVTVEWDDVRKTCRTSDTICTPKPDDREIWVDGKKVKSQTNVYLP